MELTFQQRMERGRCIARLYIAAQHLSQTASDEACDLIENCNDSWQRLGFNQEMGKSGYSTRATTPSLGFARITSTPEVVIITPPWLRQ